MKIVNGRPVPDTLGEIQSPQGLVAILALLTECANVLAASSGGDALNLDGSLEVGGAITNTVMANNRIFVDGSRSDEYTADGTIFKPYTTVAAAVAAIKAAYTAATDKQTTCYDVIIAPGTYSDKWELTTVKHVRFIGIGVILSGAITLTQSPIGGSGQQPYTRIEFIGADGMRAEKGVGMTISGAITATRTNDSLTYINFKGCWVSGNQLYDGDGTWVTHYHNCRVAGTIDTGTFATGDSTVLIETTGWNEFAGAITDKVTFYTVDNCEFYGAINITPIFDCRMTNCRFGSTVSIVASKNLSLDAITYKALMARTPTLTNMTLVHLQGTMAIQDASAVTATELTVTNAIKSGSGLGAANGATVAATEYGDGVIHKTKLTLTATPVTIVDGTEGHQGVGGVKVYDFPAGNILVLGCTADLGVLAGEGGIADAFDGDFSMGTAAGTGDDLTGTAVTLIPKTATPQANTGATTAKGKSTATELTIQDGTSSAIDAFISFLIDDADISADDTLALTGNIWITWINLGDI